MILDIGWRLLGAIALVSFFWLLARSIEKDVHVKEADARAMEAAADLQRSRAVQSVAEASGKVQ